ncbi:recombinase RarA [candidate division SR1 bacterium]|nr:recombinase RarA [candidate division SR1 bacterium]
MYQPLAYLLRPISLDKMVGQDSIRQTVQSFLDSGNLPSLIFRGSPGCGKTTLAHVISHSLNSDFFELSGVKSKKEDLNQVLELAEKNKSYGKKTILFLDEIHRWNKAQQDSLLPSVESGLITLIGATTENPSFTIINALLSRCKVLIFEPLKQEDIVHFFQQNKSSIPFDVSDDAFQIIASLSNGDLRFACNLLESSISIAKDGIITEEIIQKAFGQPIYYDRDGEEHYNIISAVHKSLRDSDGNAACYRIQRMISGGEDPRYIVRRLIRFASEDIGPADNNALLLANTVYETVIKIGLPECRLAIFQLALYLAKAPKNNVLYQIDIKTQQDIDKYGNLPVPMGIRNAPTKFMAEVGYGAGYQYAHNLPQNRNSDGTISTDNQHFPDELKGRRYF